jgi:uncharacterized protein YciI
MLLAAAALGLAACGPDSRDDEVSASEYRDRVNAICRDAERDAAKAVEESDPFERVAVVAGRYQRRLEATEPPPELGARHDEFVREGRRSLKVLEGLDDRARRARDPQALVPKVQAELRDLVTDGNAAARRLGVRDCIAEAR